MKLLLVGSGGREHALAWKLQRDDPSLEIIAAPGNPGIESIARCVAVDATDIIGLLELAETEEVDVVLVGPEAPLAADIVDVFRAAGVPIFGPTRRAAEIETSKRFSKDLMLRAGIPTARAEHFTDAVAAKGTVRRLGAPVVIKASGLAAGKGVVVAGSMAEADAAIDMMLRDGGLGVAGEEVLVEEFMQGEELSVFAITDGRDFLTMLPVQDHKRLGDGDIGPNTGGMGAYAPVSIGSTAMLNRISAEIIAPTLASLREHGRPFTGLLYAGVMLTDGGPKVVEFNCRFGDPETQAILPLMRSSLLELVLRVANGRSLGGVEPIEWEPRHAATTVVAAAGYPDKPVVGIALRLPPEPADVHVFHAGTKQGAGDALIAVGGRVVAVTAVADTLGEAARRSRDYAASVELEGKQLRRDIGWRELSRSARAS